MSAEDFARWGGETIAPRPAMAVPAPASLTVSPVKRRSRSLLRARANAAIFDGLVLLVPLVSIDLLMAQVFPSSGFFEVTGGPSTVGATVGPSGALLILALWLSYFAVCESLTGQTWGKRRCGLRVVSIDGGPAGPGAVATRSLLRLIDDLGFHLVGLIAMLLTGERRRRLGDLAGRTVVVRVDRTSAPRPRPGLRAAIYPLAWLTSVLVVVFGLGLGSAAGASQQAIALVRAYESARAAGNGALACSILSHDQQRELVALVTSDYRHAAAALCPRFVSVSTGRSLTVDYRLAQVAAGPLVTRRSDLGPVQVSSTLVPEITFYAITENGRRVLDVRGLQKLSFVHSCTSPAHGAAACFCIYEWLRAQQINPYGYSPYTALRIRHAIAVDEARCAADPARGPV